MKVKNKVLNQRIRGARCEVRCVIRVTCRFGGCIEGGDVDRVDRVDREARGARREA